MSAGIEYALVEAWIASHGESLHTQRSYKTALRVYDDFLLDEGIPFFAATACDLERFGRKLVRERRGSGAAYVFGVVRSFYRWASDKRIVPDLGKLAHVDVRRSPDRKIALGVDEARRILAAAKESCARDAAIVSLMLRGAQKPRDVIEAHMRCFYPHDGICEFQTADKEWVRISGACGQDVAAYIEATGRTGRYSNAPLFLSQGNRNKGGGLCARSVNRVVGVALAKAGMASSASSYDLGSAAFDIALEEGEPTEVLIAIADKAYSARQLRK